MMLILLKKKTNKNIILPFKQLFILTFISFCYSCGTADLLNLEENTEISEVQATTAASSEEDVLVYDSPDPQNEKRVKTSVFLNSTVLQQITAAPKSSVAGTQVNIPAGCLQGSGQQVEVKLEAGDKSYYEKILLELSEVKSLDVLITAPSILFTSSSSVDTSFKCEFEITLPLNYFPNYSKDALKEKLHFLL